MSDWTPLAVLAVALGGAWLVAVAETVVAGAPAGPVAVLRAGAARLGEPFSWEDRRSRCSGAFASSR